MNDACLCYAMQMQCNYGAKHLRCYSTCILSSCIWLVGAIPTITALGDVVLSELRGIEVACHWAEVTAVSSVLVGSMQRACPCQVRHAWPRSTSSCSSRGSG
jgi:hypothetical protein